MTENSNYQIVLAIHQLKLSKDAWPGDISRKLIGSLKGFYRKTTVDSKEQTLRPGCQLALPWSSKLNKLKVTCLYIDDRLKAELGEGEFAVPTDDSFKTNHGESNRVVIQLFPPGGSVRIGKLIGDIFVQQMYDEDKKLKTQSDFAALNPTSKPSGVHLEKPADGFRFQRLSKTINWRKVQAADIHRMIENSETKTVLSYLQDVAFGDVREQECDEELIKVVELAQYSVQYLLSSKKQLEQKRSLIHEALEVFQTEEDQLDLQLAKMRSRKKAYKREMEEMDAISQMYKLTLKSLGWSRERQQRQEQQHMASKKRGIIDDDSADDEGNMITAGSSRRHPTSSYNTWKEATSTNHTAPAPTASNNKRAANIITIPKNSRHLLRDDTVTDSQQDEDHHSTDYSEAGAPAMEDIYNPAPIRHQRTKREEHQQQAVLEVQLNASSNDLLSLRRKESMSPMRIPKSSSASSTPGGGNTPKHQQLLKSPSFKLEVANSIGGIKPVLVRSASRGSYMAENIRTQQSETVMSVDSLTQQQLPAQQQVQEKKRTVIERETSPSLSQTYPATRKAVNEQQQAQPNQVQHNKTVPAGGFVASSLEVESFVIDHDESVLDHHHATANNGNAKAVPFNAPKMIRRHGSHYDLDDDEEEEAQEVSPVKKVQDEQDDDPYSPLPLPRRTANITTHEADYDDDQGGEDDEYSDSFVTNINLSPRPGDNNRRNERGRGENDDGGDRSVIDTSKSVIVDFDLDSMSAPPTFTTTTRTASRSGPPTRENTKENLMFRSTSPEELMNLALPRRSLVTDNNMDGDDNVLLGTAKYSSTLDGTGKSSSRLSGTDQMDKDSLNGTNNNDNNRSDSRDEMSPYLLQQLNGNNNNNNPAHQQNEFEQLSYDSILAVEDSRTDRVLPEGDSTAPGTLRWETGKAPLELLELSEAFEVHIGGLRINSNNPVMKMVRDVYLELEFLDTRSVPSEEIRLRSDGNIVPISYSSHMIFNEDTGEVLREEIRELSDTVSFQVYVISAADQQPIGQAIIELWVMVENGTNILRQEVEVFAYDMSTIIGSLVIDVRGHLLFTKYAN